jgi:hypothetical protein
MCFSYRATNLESWLLAVPYFVIVGAMWPIIDKRAQQEARVLHSL